MLFLGGNITLVGIVGILLAAGIGVTIHEFAHCYIAYRMGDPTPKERGHLTLNPAVHLNLFGWLMWIVIGFGVLGTAPIAPHRMRNPRWGGLAAHAAGPVSNLLLAVVGAVLFRLLIPLGMNGTLPFSIFQILQIFVSFNVLVFLFNLIPLYPLDGWRVMHALLPPDLAYKWGSPQWIQYSQFAFFGLLLLSLAGVMNIFGMLISGPANAIINILLG